MYGELKIALKDEKNISVAELIISELDHDSIQFSEEIFNVIYNDVKDLLRNKEKFSSNYFLNHVNLNISKLASFTIGEQHFLGNWQNKDISVVEEKDILLEVTRETVLRFKLKRVQQMVKQSLILLKDDKHDNTENLTNFSRLNTLEKKIQKELGRLF